MTPQERDLIEDLFQRLKAADTAQTDGDAQSLIGKRCAEHPKAPYLLVQTVLVQEHALNSAQARIAQLEAELAELRKNQGRASSAAGGQSSFLGALAGRGPWGAHVNPAPQTQVPQTQVPQTQVPQTQVPQPQASQPGIQPSHVGGSVPSTAAPLGGGFLHSALSTAAGVAGGALLFEGIRSLFFHNPGPFGPALGYGWGSGASTPGSGGNETVINNYYADDPNAGNAPGTIDTSATPGDSPDAGTDDGSVQDASDVDTGGDFDAGASDFGGSDFDSI